MKTAAYRANVRKLIIMAGLVVLAAAAYLLVEVNPKYFTYAMRLRIPKLIVMLIAAFASGLCGRVGQRSGRPCQRLLRHGSCDHGNLGYAYLQLFL